MNPSFSTFCEMPDVSTHTHTRDFLKPGASRSQESGERLAGGDSPRGTTPGITHHADCTGLTLSEAVSTPKGGHFSFFPRGSRTSFQLSILYSTCCTLHSSSEASTVDHTRAACWHERVPPLTCMPCPPTLLRCSWAKTATLK